MKFLKSFLIFCTLIQAHLSMGQERREVFFVVSQLDLTDAQQVEKIRELPNHHSSDTSPVVIALGIGIKEKDEFEKLAENIEKIRSVFDRVFIIPGSEDWEALGADGIEDLDDFLEDEFSDDILIPDNACGELETKEIGDDGLVAAMDSKWFLQNWDKDNYINKGCKIRGRRMFWMHFSDELSGHKDRIVLLFTYHPPIRYDNASGHYPLSAHLLPAPFLGTALTLIKSHIGDFSQPTHPVYREFTSHIRRAIELEPNVISIAGAGAYQMDHYYRHGYYINVNSHNASEYIADKKVSWHSDKPAYLKIFLDDAHIHSEWYDINTHEFLHERVINTDSEISDTMPESEFTPINGEEYHTTSVLSYGDIPQMNDFLFGNLHTGIYYQDVTAPVLDLSTMKGGLKPVKIGGGRQTQSVRLRDDAGVEYVARSIRKTPTKLIPPPFDISPVESLVSHYFTGAHPYGFLVSSQLERALGLYRTDPTLMYLPVQKELEPYNDEVGNRLVLFRARADEEREDFDYMGNSENIISTDDFLDEFEENDAKPDQIMYLKARFLDILINDWDRHEDQFRWAQDLDKGDEVDTYFPIPRDRDQAFSNYNGLALRIARSYIPLIFQLKPFDTRISYDDINWAHFISAYIDNKILTDVSLEEWQETAREFKNTLAGEAIDNAVDNLPDGLDLHAVDDLRSRLHSRLAGFDKNALEYYEIVNRNAFVAGSEKDDSISVRYDKNGVMVQIITEDDDDKKFVKFDKYFHTEYTDEIWVYGAEGEDIIDVSGTGLNDIKLRLVGGFDKDIYTIDKKFKRRSRIYDLKEGNKKPKGVKAVITDNKEVISLDKWDFMKNYGWFLPLLAYNSDDGLYLGGRYRYFDYEFKSLWTHDFSAAMASNRLSTAFSYNTTLSSKLQKLDKYISINYFGPRYELNYFGTGNGTTLDTSLPDDYYFVRTKQTNIEAGIRRNFYDLSQISLGMVFFRTKVDDVRNRFVGSSEEVDEEVFSSQFFSGFKLGYGLRNFDNNFKPHNGIEISVNANFLKQLYEGTNDHIMAEAFLKFFKSMGVHEKWIFGSKIGAAHAIGDQYFYQQPSVGGNESLRGFRRDRFYGHTTFYHNNNLHYYIMQRRWNNGKNHSLGASLYFDHGRVWSESDSRENWHYSYGAGLFFSPLDVVVLSGGMFVSGEEKQIRIGMGWLL